MKRNVPCIIFMILSLFITTGLYAGGQGEVGTPGKTPGPGGNIDYVGVAAVMIRDGNYDRAAKALDEVDPDQPDLDLQRYYTLKGLIALRQNDSPAAIENFNRAIAEGHTDPVINVYLAQAYYTAEMYRETLESIDRIPNLAQYSALYGLQAESYWQLEQRTMAYATLERAAELFPEQVQFLRQQIYYLIELHLTQAAAEKSLAYISKMEQDPDAFVTVGEALRRGGNPDEAVRILEMGRLLYTGHRKIHLALAQAYLDAGQPRNAGFMIEQAASGDPALYYEAAEIYRRAGSYHRALYLNSQVLDEAKKAVQRFNILLSMERYESAAALEQRLRRNGSFSEDSIIYAMAFTLFKTRRLDEAVAYLNRIESPDYFRRATQLREAVEAVRESYLIAQENNERP